MSLNTDFNVTPYFDDFDEEKNFHRILFKPSVAVQARELTQLQTILQNQIERFGTNVLNEGTIIQGGNFTELDLLDYVKVGDNNTNNQTINVSLYQEGFTVTGTVTGLVARIVTTLQGLETQTPDLNTLYITYQNTTNTDVKTFNSNENLEVRDSSGNLIETITVAGGSDANPIGVGYGVRCGEGIIFQKGNFIRFEDEVTIVKKYDNIPDQVVVGFETVEETINSDVDTSLLDNANGFNNENAPGADRLKLTPRLITKTLQEAEEDESFFTIQEYKAGNVIRRRITTQYNLLEKLIEKRDYEKNGNYVVKPFPLSIEQSTSNTEVLNVSVGTGIAYVEGRRTELVSPIRLPFDKANETETVVDQDIIANYANYIDIENLTGFFDINTFEQIDLVNSGSTVIGSANIRSLTQTATNSYRAFVFNIQMNSGESVDNVASISSSAGSADVTSATIVDPSFKRAVFEIGQDFIESLDLSATEYTYRVANNNLETTTGGTITIDLPAGDVWPYTVSSTLNETQKLDLIFTANENVSPYSTGDIIDISGNNATVTVASESQLIVQLEDANTFPTSAMSTTGYYNAKRDVTEVNNKDLETVYVKIDTDTNVANTSGTYSLGFPDVYSIEGIWKVTGNTEYSESGADVTNDFRLYSNQKDTHYSLSYIAAKAGVVIDTGDKFLVKLKTFRKTNSVNSFFAVNSYPVDDSSITLPEDKIRTEDITIYETAGGVRINLRDAVDFRPYAANTAVYSTTISSATENPSDIVDFGASNIFFPAPNKAVETSYDYYLGRVDRLIVNNRYQFRIIEGEPSTSPVPPEEPDKSMTLALIYVRPFPSIPISRASRINREEYAVFIERVNNDNYTVDDIEQLEKRIANLEDYVSLSILEKSATDLSIKDQTGLERFKSGILVDNFEDLSGAKVSSSEFSASVDTGYKEAQPRFRSYPFDLEVAYRLGVEDYGEGMVLRHESNPVISQPSATSTRSLTSDFYYFNGNMRLNPDSDTTTDVTRAPDTNFSLDLATPFTEFNEALSEFVPLQTTDSRVVSRNTNRSRSGRTITTRTSTVTENTRRQLEVTSRTTTQNIGDFVTDFNFNPFLRSREVEVRVSGLRPNARHYFFFDGVDVNDNIAPAQLVDGNLVRTGNFSASNEIRSDANGRVFAFFRIPAGQFYVGDRELEIGDVNDYDDFENTLSSYAKKTYHGFNISTGVTNLTTTTRLPEIDVSQEITRSTSTSTRTRTIPPPPPPPEPEPEPTPPPPAAPPPPEPAPEPPRPRVPPRRTAWGGPVGGGAGDPLSQTFIIDPSDSNDEVVFATYIDVYFAEKSDTNGVTVQLREVDNGYPAGTVLPFSSIFLEPDEVNANNVTASTATRVTFEAPVALKVGQEYAVTLIPAANDPAYRAWISRTGETDVDTGISVNQDTNAGMIFTSTNNKAWTPYQDENLKFTLYRADFYSTAGQIGLTNPNNEFLKITSENDTRFLENEYVYVDNANTFLTGNVSFTAGNTIIVGTATAFESEYEQGEHIVVTNDNNDTQVLRIDSIANNTVLTVTDPPFANGVSEHFKTVTGQISYYNDRDPQLIILDNSSAKSGLVFANNDVIVGAESGAIATVSSVDNLPISYIQPNIFRSNFANTRTRLIADRLFDGTSSYSQNLSFNDNNYLTSSQTYIKSRSNEIVDDGGANSFVLTVNLETESGTTSPFVDYGISNVTLYEYLINNDSTNERSLDGEATSKFITKKVELEDGLDAEDIRVLLTAYRPPGTDVEVWVKFQADTDPNEFDDCRCVAWTKLEKKEKLNTFSSTSDRFDFREIEYVLGEQIQPQGGGAYLDNGSTFTYTDLDGAVYNSFKFYAVKIVFLSQSHNVVPRVRDMRAIAVS